MKNVEKYAVNYIKLTIAAKSNVHKRTRARVIEHENIEADKSRNSKSKSVKKKNRKKIEINFWILADQRRRRRSSWFRCDVFIFARSN